MLVQRDAEVMLLWILQCTCHTFALLAQHRASCRICTKLTTHVCHVKRMSPIAFKVESQGHNGYIFKFVKFIVTKITT